MTQMFDKASTMSKTGLSDALRSVSLVAKTNQTAGIEMVDFAKDSYAASSEAIKKLAGARTMQSALEIQTAYLKASYERLQAQANTMTELYRGLAKEIGAPLQDKTRFGVPAFFDSKTFFDPKAFLDPKNFPKLPGFPGAPKTLAA